MADADGGNYYVKFITAYGTAPETLTATNWSGSGGKWVLLDVDELPVLTYPYGTFKGWYWTETHDEDSKAEIITVSGIGTGLNVSHLTPIPESTYILYAKWESEQHLINAMDLQNIADAIREYTATTAGLKPREWASTFAEGGEST